MDPTRAVTLLKQDVFGRIELVDVADGRVVRRVVQGSRVPLSGFVARLLMRREREALRALVDVDGVPRLVAGVGRERGVLLRSFLEGTPLQVATHLPADFFDLLDSLVREIHRHGVCHNDLHKEPNILVAPDGRPRIVDFQLASRHRRRSGALFRSRCRDDLRHVAKHRERYERAIGVVRGDPSGDQIAEDAGRRRPLRPGVVARSWRILGKPIYNFVARRLLRRPDGEPRRPREGPWPEWVDPVVGLGTSAPSASEPRTAPSTTPPRAGPQPAELREDS